MHSISRRSQCTFFKTSAMRANACVLRSPLAATASTGSLSGTIAATLRRVEENSSASVLISDSAGRFSQRFDADVTVKPARPQGRRAAGEPSLNPLDHDDNGRVVNELLEARADDLAWAVESVEVQVRQRDAAAIVLVDERKGWGENLFVNPEPLSEALHKLGFACSQITGEADHPTGPRGRAPLPPQRQGFVRTVRNGLVHCD